MSVTVITMIETMGRWQPNARGRLEEAALALYGERGFEQVTVAQIAQRAGLTERTFFRHYGDKREVLFAGTDLLQEMLARGVADAPDGATPMEVVAAALAAVTDLFESRRELARRRQAIITAHRELQERELIKHATLAAALAGALRDRGVPEPAASLAGQAGMAAFRVAFERWLNDSDRGLSDAIRESFDQLRALTAEPEAAGDR